MNLILSSAGIDKPNMDLINIAMAPNHDQYVSFPNDRRASLPPCFPHLFYIPVCTSPWTWDILRPISMSKSKTYYCDCAAKCVVAGQGQPVAMGKAEYYSRSQFREAARLPPAASSVEPSAAVMQLAHSANEVYDAFTEEETHSDKGSNDAHCNQGDGGNPHNDPDSDDEEGEADKKDEKVQGRGSDENRASDGDEKENEATEGESNVVLPSNGPLIPSSSVAQLPTSHQTLVDRINLELGTLRTDTDQNRMSFF